MCISDDRDIYDTASVAAARIYPDSFTSFSTHNPHLSPSVRPCWFLRALRMFNHRNPGSQMIWRPCRRVNHPSSEREIDDKRKGSSVGYECGCFVAEVDAMCPHQLSAKYSSVSSTLMQLMTSLNIVWPQGIGPILHQICSTRVDNHSNSRLEYHSHFFNLLTVIRVLYAVNEGK